MADSSRTCPLGVPSWIDLEAPDVTAVPPFSEAVSGWTLTDAMPPGAPGRCLIATIDCQDVAAIASGVASIGTATAWNTDIAVAGAAAAVVQAAGPRLCSRTRTGAVRSPPSTPRAPRSGCGRRAAGSVRSA